VSGSSSAYGAPSNKMSDRDSRRARLIAGYRCNADPKIRSLYGGKRLLALNFFKSSSDLVPLVISRRFLRPFISGTFVRRTRALPRAAFRLSDNKISFRRYKERRKKYSHLTRGVIREKDVVDVASPRRHATEIQIRRVAIIVRAKVASRKRNDLNGDLTVIDNNGTRRDKTN